MQHKTAWNVPPPGSNRLRELVKPGGTNRLRELLKLYGREDVVAPVDEDAFGRRSSELVQARFGKIAKQCDEDEAQGLPPQRPSTKQRSSPPARKQRGSKNCV
jgi:hypothetical protein